jgi:hypothetical protein
MSFLGGLILSACHTEQIRISIRFQHLSAEQKLENLKAICADPKQNLTIIYLSCINGKVAMIATKIDNDDDKKKFTLEIGGDDEINISFTINHKLLGISENTSCRKEDIVSIDKHPNETIVTIMDDFPGKELLHHIKKVWPILLTDNPEELSEIERISRHSEEQEGHEAIEKQQPRDLPLNKRDISSMRLEYIIESFKNKRIPKIRLEMPHRKVVLYLPYNLEQDNHEQS